MNSIDGRDSSTEQTEETCRLFPEIIHIENYITRATVDVFEFDHGAQHQPDLPWSQSTVMGMPRGMDDSRKIGKDS